MSTVLILTPVIMGSWPAITAAVAGAAAALGLSLKHEIKEQLQQETNIQQQQQVEIELAESEVIAQNLQQGQEIVLAREDIELRVSRDDRGRVRICASGKGHSKEELEEVAEKFKTKMTQCFVYNKVVGELKNKDFQIIQEEVMEDDAVRINVRRWVD